jgi:hypothetical protein
MRRVPGVRFWTDSKNGFGLRRDEGAPCPPRGGVGHV